MIKERESARTERETIVHLVNNIASVGYPIIAGTALTEPGAQFGQHDLEKLYALVDAIDRETKRSDWALRWHLETTATFAKLIGEQLGPDVLREIKTNTYELQALAYLHDDVGRFFTNRYFRDWLVGQKILRRLSIREDFIRKLPTPVSFLHQEYGSLRALQCGEVAVGMLDGLQKLHLVVAFADVCGKRRVDTTREADRFGEIRPYTEAIGHHFLTRNSPETYTSYTGLEPIWPSERYALSQLEWETEYSALTYDMTRNWLRRQGIDEEQVRQQIMAQENQLIDPYAYWRQLALGVS